MKRKRIRAWSHASNDQGQHRTEADYENEEEETDAREAGETRAPRLLKVIRQRDDVEQHHADQYVGPVGLSKSSDLVTRPSTGLVYRDDTDREAEK